MWRRTARPTAAAMRGGTAFPTCRYWSPIEPQNSKAVREGLKSSRLPYGNDPVLRRMDVSPPMGIAFRQDGAADPCWLSRP